MLLAITRCTHPYSYCLFPSHLVIASCPATQYQPFCFKYNHDLLRHIWSMYLDGWQNLNHTVNYLRSSEAWSMSKRVWSIRHKKNEIGKRLTACWIRPIARIERRTHETVCIVCELGWIKSVTVFFRLIQRNETKQSPMAFGDETPKII